MLQVFVADNPATAHFVLGLLENAGIPSIVQGESQFAGLQWELPMGERLSVWIRRDEDAQRASELVEEFHRVNRGEGRDPVE